jgi:hypothetical protein
MAQVVNLITDMGPDLGLVARTAGVHKETVRYWYKKKILGKGMMVQAIPNEAALGLKPIAAKLRVASTFLPHTQAAFTAMSQLSFAATLELALQNEYYVLQASVPGRFVTEYESFIMQLKDMGVFESVELYEFDWSRRIPMHAEHYDFEASRWDYDWQNPSSVRRDEEDKPKPSAETKVDQTDLLILKELQLDASRSLIKINRAIEEKNNIELNYKTMEWHYRWHVIEGGLIDGYSIGWSGTNHDHPTGTVGHRRHRYMVVNVIVKEITDGEFLELREKVNRTPFLWSEMRGRDYLAQFAFPVEEIADAFEYLRDILRPFGEKASQCVVDQRATEVVLPYNGWNDSEEEWRLEKDRMLSHMEYLVLETKNWTAPRALAPRADAAIGPSGTP